MIGRRSFITGLVSLVAAPAIVRVGSIMPVRMMEPFVGRLEPLPFVDLLPYGRSPAMEALPSLAELHGWQSTWSAHWDAVAYAYLSPQSLAHWKASR